MTEPLRLLDDDEHPRARALLRAALDERAPEGGARRTLSALGVAAAATGAASAASAAGSAGGALSVSLLAVGKWVGGGALIGVVVATAAAPPEPSEREHAPVVAHDPRASAPEAPAPIDPPRAESKAEVVRPNAPRVVRNTIAPRAAASIAAPPPAATTAARFEPVVDPLQREIQLLDEARRALARGSASVALDLLDRHSREHSSGRLGPEAFVLRLEALIRAGQGDRARALARSWLSRHPNGPHAERIRKIAGP